MLLINPSAFFSHIMSCKCLLGQTIHRGVVPNPAAACLIDLALSLSCPIAATLQEGQQEEHAEEEPWGDEFLSVVLLSDMFSSHKIDAGLRLFDIVERRANAFAVIFSSISVIMYSLVCLASTQICASLSSTRHVSLCSPMNC